MNKDSARDYLPLVQALADGKTIQAKLHHLTKAPTWFDDNNPDFRFEPCQYRIKPEPKKGWYRVALFKDGTTDTADNLSHEVILKDHKRFVRWLTDRIEYELPEGDA